MTRQRPRIRFSDVGAPLWGRNRRHISKGDRVAYTWWRSYPYPREPFTYMGTVIRVRYTTKRYVRPQPQALVRWDPLPDGGPLPRWVPTGYVACSKLRPMPRRI